MIKVFTTNENPDKAGDELTSQFERWRQGFARGIEITGVHSNSNQYGWMLVVTYKYL